MDDVFYIWKVEITLFFYIFSYNLAYVTSDGRPSSTTINYFLLYICAWTWCLPKSITVRWRLLHQWYPSAIERGVLQVTEVCELHGAYLNPLLLDHGFYINDTPLQLKVVCTVKCNRGLWTFCTYSLSLPYHRWTYMVQDLDRGPLAWQSQPTQSYSSPRRPPYCTNPRDASEKEKSLIRNNIMKTS